MDRGVLSRNKGYDMIKNLTFSGLFAAHNCSDILFVLQEIKFG